MVEIKDFGTGSSQFSGAEKDLLNDTGFLKLKRVYDYLEDHKSCHVRINGGDYDGSIALFTVNTSGYRMTGGKLYQRMVTSKERYNLHNYWSGKLSWKGKRNNPKFILMSSTCSVLLDYEGETVLKRFNLKTESKKLLEETKLYDIDGQLLTEGDDVLYMNLRYGSGGRLCHGSVKGFKANARDGYVSVIISEDVSGEESNCNYPSSQIYRK